MADVTLAAALEDEHHRIDAGIQAYLDDPGTGTDALLGAVTLLRRHIYLEEQFLFPPVRDAGLTMPVFVMVREHVEIWRLLDEIEALAAGTTAPAGAGRTAAACGELLALLESHNAKEEPVIYPHADTDLAPAAHAHLLELLENGTLPTGWTAGGGGS